MFSQPVHALDPMCRPKSSKSDNLVKTLHRGSKGINKACRKRERSVERKINTLTRGLSNNVPPARVLKD